MSSTDQTPKVSPQAARALLGASPVPSRRCPAPGCGRVLEGRQTACSGKCRAMLSRQRQDEARQERDREVRALLEAALRRLIQPS
jgi:predicted nucleic acid-binding Zn ribbon protein